jgi:O-antigen/teichoic acid export membrane protein
MLVHTGVGFWAIQFGGLLEQNSGAFLLAHFSTPDAVAIFAVAFKICGFAGSIAGMVTQPLWPSFTEAIVRRDLDWVLRVFRKIRLGLVALSCVIAVGIIGAGNWVLVRIVHIPVRPERSLLVILAVYLVANIWTHLYYVTLMGISEIWKIASVVLAENCLMIIWGAILVPRYGASGMALGYLLASLLLPAWFLPRMFRKVRIILALNNPLTASVVSDMV